MIGSDVVISGAGTIVSLAGNALDIGTNDISITNSSAKFNTNGQNITADVLSNGGIFQLRGSETVSLTTPDIDSGIWEYQGDGDSAADTFTIKDFGATDYFALFINPTDTADIFQKTTSSAIGYKKMVIQKSLSS